jgi:hypothetical protein
MRLPEYVVGLMRQDIDKARYCSGGPKHEAYQWAEVLLALHDHRAPRLPPRRPEWIREQCLPNGERQETA